MKILLTADWHIRGDAPICRVNPGSWLTDQESMVKSIFNIATDNNIDEIWILGDVFHRARTATETLVSTLTLFSSCKQTIRILPGNHDLLYHSYSNLHQSTIGALYSLPNVFELKSFTIDGLKVEAYPFGTEPDIIPDCDIWCTHQLVFPNEQSRPIPNLGVIPSDLYAKSNAKLIVTGDYHHGYILDDDNRKLVTCGCTTIQASDMANYKTACWLLDTKTLYITQMAIPTNGDVYVNTQYQLSKSVDEYINSLSYTENLTRLDYMSDLEEALKRETDEIKCVAQVILDEYSNLNIR